MQTKGHFTRTCPPSWLGQLDINQPARVSEHSGSSCSFSDVVETYWCLSSWFQIPQQRPLLSCKKLCIHASIYMHDSLQITSFFLRSLEGIVTVWFVIKTVLSLSRTQPLRKEDNIGVVDFRDESFSRSLP